MRNSDPNSRILRPCYIFISVSMPSVRLFIIIKIILILIIIVLGNHEAESSDSKVNSLEKFDSSDFSCLRLFFELPETPVRFLVESLESGKFSSSSSTDLKMELRSLESKFASLSIKLRSFMILLFRLLFYFSNFLTYLFVTLILASSS